MTYEDLDKALDELEKIKHPTPSGKPVEKIKVGLILWNDLKKYASKVIGEEISIVKAFWGIPVELDWELGLQDWSVVDSDGNEWIKNKTLKERTQYYYMAYRLPREPFPPVVFSS